MNPEFKVQSKIFLIDAIGAAISVLFLYLIYKFEHLFGMPQNVVTVFIGIALVFCINSSTIYLFKPKKWRQFLTIIAVLNISYCLFTTYHVFQNLDTITTLGYVYFIGEIIIILTLATFEFLLAKR